MKNVIIYSRVSSDEQAKGCSLDYQEKTISEYCERAGYNIITLVPRTLNIGKFFKR